MEQGTGIRSGTVSTAAYRSESENRHLSVSRVRHRILALTIHHTDIKSAMTSTMKNCITVFGLASFVYFFTASHAGPITEGQ